MVAGEKPTLDEQFPFNPFPCVNNFFQFIPRDFFFSTYEIESNMSKQDFEKWIIVGKWYFRFNFDFSILFCESNVL